MVIQVLCGQCSGRVVFEVKDGMTPPAVVMAMVNAVKTHYDTVHG